MEPISINTEPTESLLQEGEQCHISATAPLEPCTIVIFGASGDLTTRKLIPALYTLYKSGRLPEPFAIVGCARSELTSDAFRARLRDAATDRMEEVSRVPGMAQERPTDRMEEVSRAPGKAEERPAGSDAATRDAFVARLHYRQVHYDDLASYQNLALFLHDLDQANGTRQNRIYYLAIPPDLYPVVADRLGRAGLTPEGGDGNGWARLVVEKPFGRDLDTAIALDRTMHASFREDQIFRIDHYLAKETVQNILILRFANAIFEPLWNRSFIDYIGIIAAEDLGIEHRAGYYEQAGVIRDMFQNHLMQLLALTAMEPPSIFATDRVQDEKAKVFRSLKPFAENLPEENLILGQYARGIIDGREVTAYREEPGVDPRSLTPTFAAMRLYVDNWRWQDVPFYLFSGKRLNRKMTRIIVQFKNVPHSMFRNIMGDHILANRLVLSIFPEEEISLTFQTKSPGGRLCLRPVTMNFTYEKVGPTLGAYEKVLLDCIGGDHMLFWRQDGVELSWAFLSPILAECETCGARANLLHFYPAGSLGPDQAQAWLRLICS